MVVALPGCRPSRCVRDARGITRLRWSAAGASAFAPTTFLQGKWPQRAYLEVIRGLPGLQLRRGGGLHRCLGHRLRKPLGALRGVTEVPAARMCCVCATCFPEAVGQVARECDVSSRFLPELSPLFVSAQASPPLDPGLFVRDVTQRPFSPSAPPATAVL
jgi:hypothetical protein